MYALLRAVKEVARYYSGLFCSNKRVGKAATPIGVGPVRANHQHVRASEYRSHGSSNIFEDRRDGVHSDIVCRDDAVESEFTPQDLMCKALGRSDRINGVNRWKKHMSSHIVSQAFCSALPVAYFSEVPAPLWRHFATLVLEAAYEATLWAAVCNARRGVSKGVLLTWLGGGVFGNRHEWIHEAVRRALTLALPYDLDVRLVSYGSPSQQMAELVKDFESGRRL